jgi:hypothetical protein
MSFNQRLTKDGDWVYRACWAHEAGSWWSQQFLPTCEVYDLRFESYTKDPKTTQLFVEELHKLFRGTFDYNIQNQQVDIYIDHSKYSCLANMYGLMGALRLIQEFSYILDSVAFFHDKYEDKLNLFQKIYLGYFFSAAVYGGGHDYLNWAILKKGGYSLNYFKDADYHVDKFLGAPLLKGIDTVYQGVPMSSTIWPLREGHGGPAFVQTVGLDKFNSLLTHMGNRVS